MYTENGVAQSHTLTGRAAVTLDTNVGVRENKKGMGRGQWDPLVRPPQSNQPTTNAAVDLPNSLHLNSMAICR
jgi:hypothetical protein